MKKKKQHVRYMSGENTMCKVKILTGWATGKIGILVKEYTEKTFGANWKFAIIEITHRRTIIHEKLLAGNYEIIQT